MIHPLLRFAAIVALGGAAGQLQAGDRWETLQAINTIENPTNSSRPGPHGELGPYQFRRTTWRMYSHEPFQRALQRENADGVAVEHYEWLRGGLARNGIAPTIYNIALAWNAGLTSVINDRVSLSSRRYAERVVNIVADLKRIELRNAFAVAPKSAPGRP